MDPKTVLQRRDEVQLLDVREDDEWAAGGIEGARHIPLAELPSRLGELDRSRTVVTVCRSGNRSGKAAAYLSREGLTAQNLEGGLEAWVRGGLPVTSPDGSPGHVR